MGLSKRDMAGILGVDTKTLYNWRKHRPELYRKVMQGFYFEEMMQEVIGEADRHHSLLKQIVERGKNMVEESEEN